MIKYLILAGVLAIVSSNIEKVSINKPKVVMYNVELKKVDLKNSNIKYVKK